MLCTAHRAAGSLVQLDWWATCEVLLCWRDDISRSPEADHIPLRPMAEQLRCVGRVLAIMGYRRVATSAYLGQEVDHCWQCPEGLPPAASEAACPHA